jgi:hypothetical protein
MLSHQLLQIYTEHQLSQGPQCVWVGLCKIGVDNNKRMGRMEHTLWKEWNTHCGRLFVDTALDDSLLFPQRWFSFSSSKNRTVGSFLTTQKSHRGFPQNHFSLYRHPSICILCNSRFTSYTKQPIFLKIFLRLLWKLSTIVCLIDT